MKEKIQLKAGLFIFITLVLFVGGVLILGKERNLFSRQDTFYTSFRDVSGLAEGAPIRIGGINAGRVSRIGFSRDLEEVKVQVTLLVDNKYLDRIRENSIVAIESQGLLGDKYLSISTGDPELPQMISGADLKSRDAADIGNLMSKAQTIIENISHVSGSLSDVISGLDKNTISNISSGAQALGSLAKQIEKGDGLVNRLFYSKKDGDKIMNDITKATSSVNDILTQIKGGDGFLHSIIYEKTDQELFSNLTAASKALAETATLAGDIAREVKEGKGVLHQVIYDDSIELAKTLNDAVVKLNDAAGAIKRASEALANGDGTIGALLVDSKLYDNLVEVTDGAKRSVILRHAIRSSMNK